MRERWQTSLRREREVGGLSKLLALEIIVKDKAAGIRFSGSRQSL